MHISNQGAINIPAVLPRTCIATSATRLRVLPSIAMKSQILPLAITLLLATASCLAATNQAVRNRPAEDTQVARLMHIINSQPTPDVKKVELRVAPSGRTTKVEVTPKPRSGGESQFAARLGQAQLGPGAAGCRERRIKLTFTAAASKERLR